MEESGLTNLACLWCVSVNTTCGDRAHGNLPSDASALCSVVLKGFGYSPEYASPEVLRHGTGAAGVRSDLWSCGILMLQLLLGRLPQVAVSVPRILLCKQLPCLHHHFMVKGSTNPDAVTMSCCSC
jgi:serine/threonine protein kinase